MQNIDNVEIKKGQKVDAKLNIILEGNADNMNQTQVKLLFA